MSRHHRAQHFSTASPKLRAELARLLPLPCVECGNPVMPDQAWHVAHRTAAALGGKPTRANTGAAHARCNTRAGARLGARLANAKRLKSQDIRPW